MELRNHNWSPRKGFNLEVLTDSVLKILLRCLYVLFRKSGLSYTKHSKSELPLFLYLYVYVKRSFDLLNIQILIQQQKYVSKAPKMEVQLGNKVQFWSKA